MPTYQETQQDDPIFGGIFGRPDKYDIYLACAPDLLNGYVEVSPDSDNPTKFAVTGIPADVTPRAVASHIASIAIAAHPDKLLWSAVAALPQRTILKSQRDGNVVYVDDATHWTGKRCIGWMDD